MESIEFSIMVSFVRLKLYRNMIDWWAFSKLAPEKNNSTNYTYLYSVSCTNTNLPVPSKLSLNSALFPPSPPALPHSFSIPSKLAGKSLNCKLS